MKEAIAAGITLGLMCLAFGGGLYASRNEDTPVAASLVQVCGVPLAIIVTKRNGESTIYRPGDEGVLAAVEQVPKKDMHTFSAEGGFCEKPKIY